MSKLLKIFSLTAMLTALGIKTNAQALDSTKQEIKKESTKYTIFDNSITNKNMFFGMNFGNMLLNQDYLEAGNKDVTLSIWTNYDIEKKHLIEIDFYAGYKKNIQLSDKHTLTLQPGAMYLTFPNSTWPDYREINFKAILTGLPADISIRAGKVIGEGFKTKDLSDGSIVDLDVFKTFKVSNNISVTGNLETIYNSNYFSGAQGISHAGSSIAIAYSPLENLTITGTATGQKKVNPEMEPVKTEGYYKIGLTYLFK